MTPDNAIWDKTFGQAGDIVHRKIAGEELLVPIRGELADMQRLFTLNAMGGRIWSLIDGRRTLREVAGEVFEHFDADPAQIDADIAEFLADLKAAGLVAEV